VPEISVITKPKVKYSFLKLLTGSDLSWRRLPMMSAVKSPSPVLWLTACSHGDEVGGTVIIQEVFKHIRKQNALKKGTVCAFPLMNPIGFENQSRHISFSEEDLNRSFPGNPNGSLGERLADVIFSKILASRPSLVIDLHNDWRQSIPYVLIDPDPGPEYSKTYHLSESFAKKSGLPVIRDNEMLKDSLSHSLHMNNIPSLTLELGESNVVNEKNIAFGLRTLENIMSDMGMLNHQSEPFCYRIPDQFHGKILSYTLKPFSSKTGIIRFIASPGDLVAAGQSIAKIYNTFGKLQETLKAENDGIVLGHCDSSAAFPGMPVMAFGVLGTVQKNEHINKAI
jgi:predicted deacylase